MEHSVRTWKPYVEPAVRQNSLGLLTC